MARRTLFATLSALWLGRCAPPVRVAVASDLDQVIREVRTEIKAEVRAACRAPHPHDGFYPRQITELLDSLPPLSEADMLHHYALAFADADAMPTSSIFPRPEDR